MAQKEPGLARPASAAAGAARNQAFNTGERGERGEKGFHIDLEHQNSDPIQRVIHRREGRARSTVVEQQRQDVASALREIELRHSTVLEHFTKAGTQIGETTARSFGIDHSSLQWQDSASFSSHSTEMNTPSTSGYGSDARPAAYAITTELERLDRLIGSLDVLVMDTANGPSRDIKREPDTSESKFSQVLDSLTTLTQGMNHLLEGQPEFIAAGNIKNKKDPLLSSQCPILDKELCSVPENRRSVMKRENTLSPKPLPAELDIFLHQQDKQMRQNAQKLKFLQVDLNLLNLEHDSLKKLRDEAQQEIGARDLIILEQNEKASRQAALIATLTGLVRQEKAKADNAVAYTANLQVQTDLLTASLQEEQKVTTALAKEVEELNLQEQKIKDEPDVHIIGANELRARVKQLNRTLSLKLNALTSGRAGDC